jgi:hypothetical protein
MTKLIIDTLNYFFDFTPPTTFGLQWVIWLAIGLAFSSSFYLIFLLKTSKDSLLKKFILEYPAKFITLAFLLLLNLFSRFNRIEVLSMRFITYLLLAWLIFSFYSLYQNLLINLPEKRKNQKPVIESLQQKYRILRNKKPKKLKKRR